MSGFQSFDSFEQMVEFMQQQTEQANASLTDEQRSLTWGSYWFRPYESIVIFGHVFSEAEFIERERGSYRHPLNEEEEAEFAYALLHVKENHERGYLFGEAFSVWEPRGELGDTHRASAWPITQVQFESAREAGWDHTALAVRDWLAPLWRGIQSRRRDGTTHGR